MKVYSLAIQDSTQPNRKAIITTEVLSFLSVEKKKKTFTIFTQFRLRASLFPQKPMITIANKHPR